MKKVDLHIHTSHSDDADLSPKEIVEMAKEKGLSAIAITDHNVTSAVDEALAVAGELEVIPGVEFDTNYGDNTLHILGYYLDWKSPKIDEMLDGMEKAKKEQFYGRIEKLQELGYSITANEVLEKSDVSIPLGGFIAEVLLAKEENKEDQRLQTYYSGEKSDQPYFNFYLDFFKPGAIAEIPCWKPDAKGTIELIRELGGVAVLAHPGSTLDPLDEEVIDDLMEAGLEGLEVYSTYHNKKEMEEWLRVAQKKELLATAGSDFHGHLKPKIDLGGVPENDYTIIEKLKELRSEG